MRKLDHNGLLLSEYQGKLFEKSAELECSSPVFIRRFLHADLVRDIDSGCNAMISLEPSDGIECIEQQFGRSRYGKEKYSKGALFWIGYMYRYIAYTREQPTMFVINLFKHKLMNDVYYAYHTQNPEWCIKSLLEINNLTEDIFDNNFRLKNALINQMRNKTIKE